ncbi:hypothetical protein A2303_00670 [Candidatus Falkowbacteria bacterium RIFOXYB2_FULL_47_14]|uniref:Uncharacterized protein n=1 Tax=Candidatus Falkowbacteria bacterium RIFOXYA2_FULL_47_19 TaxID=1797994 RepID=A0A1F5SNS8_9BACT|nr:MAG: hypothetical protein A2227_05970 [Candidatus Falkowbacteria bacterium RIFOXYA2_FULL_47_19]OGF36209.1 MAG: hypothetical protein A2468_06520 [Candidatus Falkowbacteria bacterium RIFOXYC2_FULL_46_15]OGF42884.1 MAG: hypothetical protein A2303_00670 [Candidatus Falkowbacteria bacterium RIFOXYB2_FULL_47_14]
MWLLALLGLIGIIGGFFLKLWLQAVVIFVLWYIKGRGSMGTAGDVALFICWRALAFGFLLGDIIYLFIYRAAIDWLPAISWHWFFS